MPDYEPDNCWIRWACSLQSPQLRASAGEHRTRRGWAIRNSAEKFVGILEFVNNLADSSPRDLGR